MTPRGFWSYARGDDEHLDRRLSELRKRVAGEISTLLGRDIGMFQDVYDIRTGDDWQDKLRAELTGASFLVPVLTPRYFERPWCREELMAFIQLAEEAGRPALLFPIYFVRDRRYDRGEHCEVRAAVARRQYLDFRELRFESDPSRIERAIHEFANDVVDALEKAAGAAPKPAPPPPPPVRPEPVAEPSPSVEAEEPRRAPKAPKVPELVVDPWPGRGDHTSIQAAIKAAREGSRILIRPGLYAENVTLAKALELIGDGPREDIVIAVSSGDAMRVTANIARVAGLTLRRDAGEGEHVALWVTAGRAEFEDCAFTSQSLSCAEIVGAGTAPVFRRCRFHDGAQNGLFFCEDARGLVEECESTGNAFSGVQIIEGADPVLRRCVLRGNRQAGAFVNKTGRGSFEDCEIVENGKAGVAIREGGRPTLRGCRIGGNALQAIWIYGAGSGGTFEGNDLRGNTKGAWRIDDVVEANITRRGNTED